MTRRGETRGPSPFRKSEKHRSRRLSVGLIDLPFHNLQLRSLSAVSMVSRKPAPSALTVLPLGSPLLRQSPISDPSRQRYEQS